MIYYFSIFQSHDINNSLVQNNSQNVIYSGFKPEVGVRAAQCVAFFPRESGCPILTLRRPFCKKLRMRWFYVSKVKESSFLKSDLTDLPHNFDAHLLETTDLSPSRFHFSVGVISRSCFESDRLIAYSNEWDGWETMFIHTYQPIIT